MNLISKDDYDKSLAHYGILRRSGRYPWGSGGNQDESTIYAPFLDWLYGLRKQGLSDPEIARAHDITTTQLRALNSIAKNQKRAADITMAQRLKEKGMSNVAIGKRMGIPESSVRNLLAPGEKDRVDVLTSTSNMLKDQVDTKGYIDIGSGVENHIGVSQTKLSTAVAMLKEQGYEVHKVQVDQLGTNNKTIVKVLAPPGTTYLDVKKNLDKIQQIQEFSDDGGRSFFGLKPIEHVAASRVAVRYAEEGGADADGVMYIRPGTKDLDLGDSKYAQVRIGVDGTHYLKGMAMYKEGLPDGVDIQFNTNKSSTGDKLDALKKLSDDPDNPFGAVIKPGGQRGALNIVNEEGDWDNWSRNLSSQTLSKQSPTLAKSQLDMTYDIKKSQLAEIQSLTNPAVRRKLLQAFADEADSSAVHLKAAALPRSSWHVILPFNNMKENEVYAPNFNDGERVALIRYPHGGTFEIPELTVNNRNRIAKSALKDATDAIGINAKVAERLSGADFDGDAVLVIPNNSGRIKSTPALKALKDFDPQRAYPGYEGMPKMTARTKGIQMGLVSNLITDMTIQRASMDEIARAVKHSMVVIDAEKHGLNYKQSAVDNGIPQLMKKYQGRSQGGASTLISRATSQTRVPERKATFDIDPATGRKIPRLTGETYVDKRGRTVERKTKSVQLAETDDAFTLSSGTKMEAVYAQHSNRLKSLANQARKEMVATKTIPYSPSAAKVYRTEVKSLDAKLQTAFKNRPLERQAQLIANAVVEQKRRDKPDMEPTEVKKVKSQALAEARLRTGAKKQLVKITPSEWKAIQEGAISNNKLTDIMNNTDLDELKKLATPRTPLLMTSAKTNRAKTMLASGYTQAEVAAALGVSLTTLKTGIA